MTEPQENVAVAAEGEALEKTLQEMMVRAAVDMDFRARLIADPRSAMADYGCELAPEADIRFVENTRDATIVLPDFVGDADPQDQD